MTTELLKKALSFANELFSERSNILEFGVYSGGTYNYLCENMEKNFTLWGFDSFEGLPAETEGVWFPERHAPKNYGSPRYRVDKIIASKPKSIASRCKIVEGWFDKTLTESLQQEIEKCALVNIDVDLHSSSMLVLDFIKPLLQVNTVLYWDDWKDPVDKYKGKWGEHLAFEQWSSKNPEFSFETLDVNKVNQRIMICKEVV